ncbi:uncharacterized protein LOC117179975 [Belonocnema kinseyi]|uniref:uncharacterized protein LOC117179975 n=1 Tax=Belonocnema kinseyi TaxID=2817044 RepID=UPI00143DE8BC|nr:uncharacterized protein LOC117179975 [Belonocnema kinseyi]
MDSAEKNDSQLSSPSSIDIRVKEEKHEKTRVSIEYEEEELQLEYIKLESLAPHPNLDNTFHDGSKMLPYFQEEQKDVEEEEEERIQFFNIECAESYCYPSEDQSSNETDSLLLTDDPLSLNSNREEENDTVQSLMKSSYFWKPLPPCTSKCHILINEENQKRIFDSYSNAEKDERISFLESSLALVLRVIEKGRKKYVSKYSLETEKGRQEVCRECFCHIIDEDSRLITILFKVKLFQIQSSSVSESNSSEQTDAESQTSWKRIPRCTNNCYLKVTEDDQRCIFDAYSKEITQDSRDNCINGMIEILGSCRPTSPNPLKLRCTPNFYLNTSNGRQQVCIDCFCLSINETKMFVAAVVNKKWDDMQQLEGFQNKSEIIQNSISPTASLPPRTPDQHLKVKENIINEDKTFVTAVVNKKPDDVLPFVTVRIENSVNSTNKNLDPHPKVEKQIINETKTSVATIVNKNWDDVQPLEIVKIPNVVKPPVSLTAKTINPYLEIEEHIKKFPLCESNHFDNNSSEKYLPMGLSVRTMYEIYKQEVSDPVSVSVYQRILAKSTLKFRPNFLGKCEKCEITKRKLKVSCDEENKLNNFLTCHFLDAREGHDSKSKDEYVAKRSNNSLLVYTFSFQITLPTPFLEEPTAYYKRPLSTYNFTIQQQGNGTWRIPKFYMWHEGDAKKTAKEIASCLYQHLLDLPPCVKSVILYSANNRENRSKSISKMFLHLLENHKTLKTVIHKFLIYGHSQIHKNLKTGWDETIMKSHHGKIQEPKDWYDAFAKRFGKKIELIVPKVIIMTPEMFYDFESCWKGDDDSFIDEQVKWLRYTKEGVYYKNSWSEIEQFKALNINGKSDITGLNQTKLASLGQVGISEEKKKGLLELLPFLRPEVASFYEGLPVENKVEGNLDNRLNQEIQIIQKVPSPPILNAQTCILKEEVDLGILDLEDKDEEIWEPPKKIYKKMFDTEIDVRELE